jgi:hypothetical protein
MSKSSEELLDQPDKTDTALTTLHQRAARAADVARTREHAPLREFHAALAADLVAARNALDALHGDIEANRPRLAQIAAQFRDARYDAMQGLAGRLVKDARATATGKLAQCTDRVSALSRWIERVERMQPEDLASAPVATYVEEERYRLAGFLGPLDLAGTCTALEALAQEIVDALPASLSTPAPGRALTEDERKQLRAEPQTHARSETAGHE